MRYPVVDIVANDTRPRFLIQLGDDNTETGRDLSASSKTITMIFREAGAAASLFESTLTKLYTATHSTIDGWVMLTLASTDLEDLEPGMYEGQIILTDGSTEQTALGLVKFRLHERFAEAP